MAGGNGNSGVGGSGNTLRNSQSANFLRKDRGDRGDGSFRHAGTSRFHSQHGQGQGRPRGVYTAHHNHPQQNFNHNQLRQHAHQEQTQGYNSDEFANDSPPRSSKSCHIAPNTLFVPATGSIRSNSLSNMANLTNAYKSLFELDSEDWLESQYESAIGAFATTNGLIQVNLHSGIRVYLTVDKAIRVLNYTSRVILSLSSTGSSAALIHPNGKVYQYGTRVEIKCQDHIRDNHKYAKMWYKGISFSSENCSLIYMVDSAGTRTTSDNFSDMGGDFSMQVFLQDSQYGPQLIKDCTQLLQMATYWVSEDGVENWIINGIRISQTPDGMVRVGRGQSKYLMRTSPSNGTASFSTPYMHATASCGPSKHMFVKRGERRMHFDGASFTVRNAGHSAGFDEFGQVKVY